MQKAKTVLLISAVLACFVAGFCSGRKSAQKCVLPPSVAKVDTLIIRDTLTVTQAKYVNRKVIDSVLVPVADTVTVHDTCFVLLAREQIQWVDSLCTVYASGIRPQIDSVKHFTADRVITKQVTQVVKRNAKWGIGLNAGYGAGREGLTPYIGVGVTYNIISW